MLNSTHKKEQKLKRKRDKDGKVLYKSMNNAVYEKIMENLRNRIHVKLVSIKSNYLKWVSNQAPRCTKYFTMIQWQFVKIKLH